MNRGVVAGLAAGVALIAVAAALLVRSDPAAVQGPQATAPVTAMPPAQSGAGAAPVAMPPGASVPPVAADGAGRVPADPSAAPWLGSAGARASAPGSAPSMAAGRAGAPSLDDIQKRLQAMLAQPQPDVREVDAVLADLQRNQGSTVVAGVDLQAVRDNLARSERIRQISVEMQALAAKPGPDVPAQLQSRMAEIQRLQAGMTGNVAAPAGAAR